MLELFRVQTLTLLTYFGGCRRQAAIITHLKLLNETFQRRPVPRGACRADPLPRGDVGRASAAPGVEYPRQSDRGQLRGAREAPDER